MQLILHWNNSGKLSSYVVWYTKGLTMEKAVYYYVVNRDGTSQEQAL